MKPIQYILFFLFSGWSPVWQPLHASGNRWGRAGIVFHARRLVLSGKRWLPLCMGMLWMTGCAEQQEEGYETPERIPVQFTSSIGGGAVPVVSSTRTTNNGDHWDSGDEVGIFMKYAGEPLREDQVAEGAKNIKYIASGYGDGRTAYLEPEEAAERIYYPASQSVDFIAYYPYGDVYVLSNQYVKQINVRHQYSTLEQANMDLLYSNNRKNLSKDQENSVELEFKHMMSRLVINVIAGRGVQDDQSLESLKTMNVEIYRMPTTALFSLSDGHIYDEGNTGGTARMRRWDDASSDTYVSTYDIILLPQQSGIYPSRQVQFAITKTGRVFKWVLDDDIVFEQGKIHTWDITVNDKLSGRSVQSAGYPVSAAGMEIEVGSCTVTDWNTSCVEDGSDLHR